MRQCFEEATFDIIDQFDVISRKKRVDLISVHRSIFFSFFSFNPAGGRDGARAFFHFKNERVSEEERKAFTV